MSLLGVVLLNKVRLNVMEHVRTCKNKLARLSSANNSLQVSWLPKVLSQVYKAGVNQCQLHQLSIATAKYATKSFIS